MVVMFSSVYAFAEHVLLYQDITYNSVFLILNVLLNLSGGFLIILGKKMGIYMLYISVLIAFISCFYFIPVSFMEVKYPLFNYLTAMLINIIIAVVMMFTFKEKPIEIK